MFSSDRGRFQILIILSDDDKESHLPSIHLDLVDDLDHDKHWDQCLDKCAGQEWDAGFVDMVQPCGSSIIHSLSIIIILIISLVR